ncbi:unnamed protein product [Absidia cylindrospora]
MGFYSLPSVLPNMVHFPALLPKVEVKTTVIVGKDGKPFDLPWDAWDTDSKFGDTPSPVPAIPVYDGPTTHLVKTKLIHLAYGRSGDKGDVSNIGIIARDPRYTPFIKRSITEQAVSTYMEHLCKGGNVKRYELPGLNAFNFVLTKALGGGGISSLSVDRQGKTYAQLMISGMTVEIPSGLLPPLQRSYDSLDIENFLIICSLSIILFSSLFIFIFLYILMIMFENLNKKINILPLILVCSAVFFTIALLS